MVGRDDEVRTAAHALTAARAGRGSSMFAVGESGIGKSRLATVVTQAGLATNMTVLRGRGSSVGPIVPFRPLTEALMSLLRSEGSADLDELGAYRPVLARLIPDLGLPADGTDSASLTVVAEAVLRLCGLVSRGRGCLFVLEDLQDADAETLAVVEYLTDNLGQQPIVLLGTIRTDPSPALELARSAAQRGSATLVELVRLSASDVRLLVGSCLGVGAGEVPADVAEQLWATSAGVPLLVEESLNGMLRCKLLVLDTEGWRVTEQFPAQVPTTLARAIAGRLEIIGQQGRDLLSAAAVLGPRFPFAILRVVSGLADRELLTALHTEQISQLIVPDEELPDWYAFQHPLIVEAMLALLTPSERTTLARQAADAIEAVYPGLPGEWRQAAAALRQQAGDRTRAGQLYAEAGRRAAAQGAASSAVTLLDKGLELLTPDGEMQERADTLADLLTALAEAGLVERAISLASKLGQMAGPLSRHARARLHTRLAWAAVIGGRFRDGQIQIDIARDLLGPDASAQDSAPVDLVAAHLVLDLPGPDQIAAAEALAQRAADVAEAAGLPVVACQAWQLLGGLRRARDLDDATNCLERAYQIAVRQHLRMEEIQALIRLGSDDLLRHHSLERLRQATVEASRAGAVTARYMAEESIAFGAVLQGDFAVAETILDQVLESTMRLRLLDMTQYTLLVKAILGAHQGRRREMNVALAELRRWDGDNSLNTPRAYGLARAWCSLLEENRARALRELATALAAEEQNPTFLQLSGRYGLHLLLGVLDGTAGRPEYRAITAAPLSKLRWDRQFCLLADGVLAGREGQAAKAAEAVAEATRVGAPYPTGRHLGLRLVSEAAIADGWGTPIEWLRTAEDYFYRCQVPAVTSACRALLRRAGAPVYQHRQGTQHLPAALRATGVTVREHEILQLLRERLSNREIATRLHLSPRTVEKHVASLIIKTGQANRITLGEYGSAILD